MTYNHCTEKERRVSTVRQGYIKVRVVNTNVHPSLVQTSRKAAEGQYMHNHWVVRQLIGYFVDNIETLSPYTMDLDMILFVIHRLDTHSKTLYDS